MALQTTMKFFSKGLVLAPLLLGGCDEVRQVVHEATAPSKATVIAAQQREANEAIASTITALEKTGVFEGIDCHDVNVDMLEGKAEPPMSDYCFDPEGRMDCDSLRIGPIRSVNDLKRRLHMGASIHQCVGLKESVGNMGDMELIFWSMYESNVDKVYLGVDINSKYTKRDFPSSYVRDGATSSDPSNFKNLATSAVACNSDPRVEFPFDCYD